MGDEKGDVSRETALQALRKDWYYQRGRKLKRKREEESEKWDCRLRQEK